MTRDGPAKDLRAVAVNLSTGYVHRGCTQGDRTMAPACTRYRSFERSRLCRRMTGLVAATVSAAGAAGAATIDDLVSQGLYCSATAQAMYQACNPQTQNDYLIAVAI